MTSQLEDVQAEMLPYTMATKPYSFLWWLYHYWCCLRLSNKVSKSALPVTLPFSYHT